MACGKPNNSPGGKSSSPDDAAEKEEFAADIYLVLHEDLRRSPKIRAVADFLGEVLAEQAG